MDPQAALPSAALVLGLAAALGVAFGYASQRSHFCTMGAVADVVSMGSWTRMRMWLLAMAVAVAGTSVLQAAGWLNVADTVHAGTRLPWLSRIVGGALFGAGMALAGGCAGKTAVRLGGGNLKSVVVFLVMGLVAYMTLKGVLAVPRVRGLDTAALALGAPQDLPSLLAQWGVARGTALAACTVVVAGALAVFALRDAELRRGWTLAGSVAIGLAVVAGWVITAHVGYVAEHPETLEPAFVATYGNRAESLSFVAPYAYTLELLTLWTDASRHATFGVAALAGVVGGAGLAAWRAGEWRLESFRTADDLLRHLAGAALMGFGGVTALGCTIGQGLTGVSVLSLGSVLALLSMMGGCAVVLYALQARALRA